MLAWWHCKQAVGGVEWIGYDVEAYRSNANRRQRGQLINTRRYPAVQHPWRMPIAVERPAHKGAEDDAARSASSGDCYPYPYR